MVVARVALGLTLYLDEPATYAKSGAAEILASFLQYAPAKTLAWYKTSLLPDWRRLDEEALRSIQQALSLDWWRSRPRRDFSLQLVDDPAAPSVGFAYHEVDPDTDERTPVLQLVLPQDHNHEDLLALALEVCDRHPLWSGIGGHLAIWNERERLLAFRTILAWCRRHLGLDVQVPNEMALAARRGLPGSGWLTIVGAPLAAALDLDIEALTERAWRHDVTVLPMRRGVLMRAGAAPVLGDMNHLEYPSAYAEVASALGEHFVDASLLYWGRFSYDDLTNRWLRRFVEPGGWA